MSNPAASAAESGSNDPPGPPREPFLCDYCDRCFSSTRGRTLHVRRAHPVEFHANAEARGAARSALNWKEEEKELLAQAEARMICDGSYNALNINTSLVGSIGLRTHQAIKGRRRNPDHKARVLRWTNVWNNRELIIEEPQKDLERPDWMRSIIEYLLTLRVDPEQWGGTLLCDAISDLTTEDRGLISPRDAKARSEVCVADHTDRIVRYSREYPTNGQRRHRRPHGQGPAHTGPPREAPSRRALRRSAYKRVQALYINNRKLAAELCLSGGWACPEGDMPEGMLDYWKQLFETESLMDNLPVVRPQVDKWDLMEPITTKEIEESLTNVKESTPGWDGISLAMIRAMPANNRAAMLNIWLVAGIIPVPLRKGVTSLIGKTPNPEIPGQHRPITVCSQLVRLFNRILAKRLERACPGNERQKAFRPLDGCQENLVILDAALGRARSLQSDVHMVFLDMAKAFDSVSRDTVRRALIRVGVPAPMREIIMSGFDGATTELKYKGCKLGEVEQERGVRQGDPLSPFLFNLVLDEALEKIAASPIGVALGNEGDSPVRVSVLAFADDLVLMAETRDGLQALIDEVTQSLKAGGLVVNPDKCRSLTVKVDRAAKSWFVASQSTVTVDNEEITVLSPADSYEYLGILVGADGRRPSYGGILEDGLLHLTKAPLEPQQRLYFLVNHLIPRLTHRLVLGRVYRTQLGRLDARIRTATRSWLGLPHDTPSALLYSSVKDGGLGLPCMASLVPLQKQRRLERLSNSGDPVVRTALRCENVIWDQWYWAGPVRCGNVDCRSLDDCKREWARVAGSTVDGRGLVPQAQELPKIHNWISAGTRMLSGGILSGPLRLGWMLSPPQVGTLGLDLRLEAQDAWNLVWLDPWDTYPKHVPVATRCASRDTMTSLDS